MPRRNYRSSSAPSQNPGDETGCYDGAIMMSRTQVTLEPETQRLARKRASELGVAVFRCGPRSRRAFTILH
jgi:hypothetical protein